MMHELAVCQALLQQVTEVATENSASKVTGISIQIGPLSGVEIQLLQNAFSIARLGTLASTAKLTIDAESVIVACRQCGIESKAEPNYLRCPSCGSVCSELVSGDALTLVSLAIDREGALHV